MHEYWSWPRPAARMMVPWAHRRLRARANGLAAADRVVAVSETVRRRIRDVVSEAGTVVVPNIVDPRQVETGAARGAADAAGGPAGGFLLTAGKLQPTKGFDRLLAMVAAVGSPLPLKVAGDGPCLDALRAQAASTGLRVEFLGWVNHDRLLALQRDAAAVVLPSAWDEPLSRLVLETMGLGTPVVAWAQGGNREIIESDVTGWLVTDAADLRAAWQALSSPARRAEVGREARRHVVERYSPAAVYPAIETAYRAAVGAASRSRRA